MALPTVDYGNNTLEIDLGNLTLYYSYKTVIAFHTYETGTVVSENIWGVTTGKHLNAIDDGNKKARLSRDVFERRLHDVLVKFGLEDKA